MCKEWECPADGAAADARADCADAERIGPREDETLEELGRGGLRILQKKRGFRFGTDSILLADFACGRGARRVGDFGTGSCILPLLMSDNAPRTAFDAWEIQPGIADMAARCVRLNGLESRICVRQGDARLAARDVGLGALDMVVCNPPYYRKGAGAASEDESMRIAKHGEPGLVGELVGAAGRALRCGGKICMVYPAEGAADLICMLRAADMEPKRLRLVHAGAEHAPSLMLIEGMKGAKPGLRIMPPLLLRGADGAPSAEFKRIYHLEE